MLSSVKVKPANVSSRCDPIGWPCCWWEETEEGKEGAAAKPREGGREGGRDESLVFLRSYWVGGRAAGGKERRKGRREGRPGLWREGGGGEGGREEGRLVLVMVQ